MVDLGSAVAEEGEAVEPPLPFARDLLEWDKINGVPLVASVSPPPKSPRSMVAIRNPQKHDCKDPPIIFPPVDHENLHVSHDSPPNRNRIPYIHAVNQRTLFSDSDSDSDSDSSSTFSPSDSSPLPRSPIFSDLGVVPAADALGLFGSWKKILNFKVNSLARFFWSALTSSRRVLLNVRSITAILIAFLYFRRRSILRSGEESRDRLIDIIKERDEKINQLLDQISRMNQVLLALHKVPTP